MNRQEEDMAVASITDDKKDEENKHVNKTSIRIVFSTGAIWLIVTAGRLFAILFFYFNICMIDKKYNEYYAPH